MRIYHNPRCRKSRETLNLLIENGKSPEVIEYLKTPPTASELKEILSQLNLSAIDLIRKGEDIYKSEFKGKDLSESEWIDAMINNPKLIERPIVLANGKAKIGRPPESVLTII